MNKLEATFIAGSAVIAANAAGARSNPQQPRNAIWYASLRKPEHTPSGPTVGAVWTTLDVLLTISGTRLLRSPPHPARTTALGCWALTVAGIAGYPWVFFERKRLDASAVTSAAMLASASAYVAAAARVDRPAAVLGVPLVAWLGLATLLSEELWRRNR